MESIYQLYKLSTVNGCPYMQRWKFVPNDACSGAQNLGLLPLPPLHALNGIVHRESDKYIKPLSQTAEIPYRSLSRFAKPIGGMSNPATDALGQIQPYRLLWIPDITTRPV